MAERDGSTDYPAAAETHWQSRSDAAQRAAAVRRHAAPVTLASEPPMGRRASMAGASELHDLSAAEAAAFEGESAEHLAKDQLRERGVAVGPLHFRSRVFCWGVTRMCT